MLRGFLKEIKTFDEHLLHENVLCLNNRHLIYIFFCGMLIFMKNVQKTQHKGNVTHFAGTFSGALL